MGRAILAVIVGYIAMFAFMFVLFTCAYFAMGANRAFEPGSFDPSMPWNILSIFVGLLAAMVGGWVCGSIAKTATPVKVLIGIVFVVGLASAVPVLMAKPSTEVRPDTLSNLEAMTKAQQPLWIAVLNPFLGAVGIFIGSLKCVKKPAA